MKEKESMQDRYAYGSRLLKGMGWSEGKGLGRNEDGMKEALKVQKKFNTKGMGFNGVDDKWVEHQEAFDQILSQLNGGTDQGDGNHKLTSIEERSRTLGGRVHYSKFLRSKDLSQKKNEDIEAIFVAHKKRKKEMAPPKPEEKADEETQYKIFKSDISYQEYFTQQMKSKRQARRLGTRDAEGSQGGSNVDGEPADASERNGVEDGGLGNAGTVFVEKKRKEKKEMSISSSPQEKKRPLPAARDEDSSSKSKKRLKGNPSESSGEVAPSKKVPQNGQIAVEKGAEPGSDASVSKRKTADGTERKQKRAKVEVIVEEYDVRTPSDAAERNVKKKKVKRKKKRETEAREVDVGHDDETDLHVRKNREKVQDSDLDEGAFSAKNRKKVEIGEAEEKKASATETSGAGATRPSERSADEGETKRKDPVKKRKAAETSSTNGEQSVVAVKKKKVVKSKDGAEVEVKTKKIVKPKGTEELAVEKEITDKPEGTGEASVKPKKILKPKGSTEVAVKPKKILKPKDTAEVTVKKKILKPKDTAEVTVKKKILKPKDTAEVTAKKKILKPKDTAEVTAKKKKILKPKDTAEVKVKKKKILKPEGSTEVAAKKKILKPKDTAEVTVKKKTTVKSKGTGEVVSEKGSNVKHSTVIKKAKKPLCKGKQTQDGRVQKKCGKAQTKGSFGVAKKVKKTDAATADDRSATTTQKTKWDAAAEKNTKVTGTTAMDVRSFAQRIVSDRRLHAGKFKVSKQEYLNCLIRDLQTIYAGTNLHEVLGYTSPEWLEHCVLRVARTLRNKGVA